MYSVSINDRVHNIKGSNKEIDKFVEEYKPFIAACVERATGRYVRYGEDDELSIGLMAFVEAIDSYDKTKGNFLSFAQNVIKRRLIDYYRKEKKHSNVISIEDFRMNSQDEVSEVDLSMDASIEKYNEDEMNRNRQMEIQELDKELKEWGISFSELVAASPKAEKTRKTCREILKFILSNKEMTEFIKTKRYLPVAEIHSATDLPRKNIERARKYIIAVVLIKTGDYRYISDYVEIV